MKISISKAVTLGGLCALFAGAGNAAIAQGYDHQDGNNQGQSSQSGRHYDHGQNGQYNQNQNGQGRNNGYDQGRNQDGDVQDNQYRQADQYRRANQTERRRLDRLHAAYAHAAAKGQYNAAERAHLHAQAIRARLRSQHDGNNGQYRDNGQYRNDNGQHGDNNQDARDRN